MENHTTRRLHCISSLELKELSFVIIHPCYLIKCPFQLDLISPVLYQQNSRPQSSTTIIERRKLNYPHFSLSLSLFTSIKVSAPHCTFLIGTTVVIVTLLSFILRTASSPVVAGQQFAAKLHKCHCMANRLAIQHSTVLAYLSF